VSGYVQPEQTIRDVYVVSFHYALNTCGSWYYYVKHISDQILAGTKQEFQLTIYEGHTNYNMIHQYTIFALYDNDNDGVTAGIGSGKAQQAILNAQTWSEYFSNSDSFGMSESTLAYYIKYYSYNNSYFMPEFCRKYSNYFSGSDPGNIGEKYGTPLTLVNFSTASYGGVAYAEIPEPTSAMILLVGAGIVGISRRRLS